MSRRAIIVVATLVAAAAFVVYLQTRPPAGLEPMGDAPSAVVSWIALATAVTGLLTALTNLVLALRKSRV